MCGPISLGEVLSMIPGEIRLVGENPRPGLTGTGYSMAGRAFGCSPGL
jgi:hypothetical protein